MSNKLVSQAKKTNINGLTVANVAEKDVQSERSILKYRCRYFFHAGELVQARYCLGIRENVANDGQCS
jgi:hypothetical protein